MINHLAAVLACVAAVGSASPARAHAFLRGASPAVGSTVATAPASVAIDFTEGVEPAFSSIAVTDEAGVRVDRGAPRPGADDAQLVVALRPLPPGRYRVSWHAVATDTHHTEGSFGFTVAP